MRAWGEPLVAIGWCVLLLTGGIAGGTTAQPSGPGASTAPGDVSPGSESLALAGSANQAATDPEESNDPPLADAGLDQQVQVNTTVYLDATGSYDPDGSIRRYEWRIEHPDGEHSSPVCATCDRTSFVADERGVYEVTVTVTDDDGAQRSDTLRVNVTAAGGPQVRLRGPRRVRPGTDITFTADATADDVELARALWFVDGRRVDRTDLSGESATAALSRTFAAGTTHTVRVVVVDWVGRRAVDRTRVTVLDPPDPPDPPEPPEPPDTPEPPTGSNQPPSASASATSPVEPGETVVLDGTASDPDGDALRYQWSAPAGSGITVVNAESRDASFVAPNVSSVRTYTVQFRVSDGTATATADAAVTVRPPEADDESTNATGPGDSLSVAATADSPVPPGATVTLDGSIWDVDGTPLEMQWTQQSGPGVSISNADSVDAEFVAPAVSEPVLVEFRFTAEAGDATDTATARVLVDPESSSPSGKGAGLAVEASAPSRVESGETVTLDGTVSNSGGGQLVHSWSQKFGSTLSIENANSEDASFVAPDVSNATEYDFSFTVNNGEVTRADSVTVTVLPPDSGGGGTGCESPALTCGDAAGDREEGEGCLVAPAAAGSDPNKCQDGVRFLGNGKIELRDNDYDNKIRYRGLVVKTISPTQDPIIKSTQKELNKLYDEAWAEKYGKSDDKSGDIK